MDTDELLRWAHEEAQNLRTDGRASLGPAVEFLRLQAHGTDFAARARTLANKHVGATTFVRNTTRNDLADLLDAWTEYVNAGLASVDPFEVSSRVEAATDLMEQVELLLGDKRVHPAAPAVLAGAALEEFLRSMAIAVSATVAGSPSLSKYADALKKAESLTTQDVKDITAWAGLRNSAAHGDFDKVSLERVRLMADGINLFMRQKTK